MTQAQLNEMGPVDYVVLEWATGQPTPGEVQPLLLDLVDRGVIRILDIAFLAKDRDGSLSGMEVGGGLNQLAAAFAEFEGGVVRSARRGRPAGGRHRCQQPCLAPAGRALAATGVLSLRPARACLCRAAARL